MKLNLKKTKLMLFNPCRIRDFMPEFHVGQARIDLVEETKLLGVIIRSALFCKESLLIKNANSFYQKEEFH